MDEKDNYQFDDKDQKPDQSTRARNRTVMLTPDITGQVRAKLNQSAVQTVSPYSTRENDVAATIAPQGVAPVQGFYSQAVHPAAETHAPSAQPARPAPEAPRHQPVAEPVRVAAPQAPVSAPVVPSVRSFPDLAVWANDATLAGFLVSYDRNSLGEVCSLRTGRMIVTSVAQANGNFLLIEESTVSPLHAIMRITATGEIQILDQLSESGTFIKRFGSEDEIELSGEKSFLEHGDTVRFGERTFHVTVILRGEG